jgi:hypothetical protein
MIRNSLPKRIILLFFSLLLAYLTGAQTPGNLEIIATSGGLVPDSEASVVHIQSDGSGSYTRYLPDDPVADPLENQTFTLTSQQLLDIYNAIQNNNFYSLDNGYTDTTITDRTYANLHVIADANNHSVWTQNIAVTEFDNIMTAINAATAPEYNLEYDISVPEAFEQVDICGPAYKSAGYLTKPNRQHLLPELVYGLKSANDDASTAHPGTFVAYELSLQEAVNKRIATLSGKDEYFGDAIAITGNNTTPYSSNQVKVKLHIEFWGPGATAANIAKVKNAITSHWSNKTTSDGKEFIVEVITRGSTQAWPHSTAGYHQIKLDPTVKISNVWGMRKRFDLNWGVGSGKWRTSGTLVDKTWAHEAGHLMCLPDTYDDYRKKADGTWRRESDGQTFTSEQLANMYYQRFGTTEEIMKQAFEDPDFKRHAPPHDGHENDIMTKLTGNPTASTIDKIASKAGLVIDVKPGDILINKNEGNQNIMITRSERFFVKKGESKTLAGLFGACIDAHDGIPSSYDAFDVAPNLIHWSNFESAQYLLNLVNYIDSNDLFCTDSYDSQMAIWRISDNNMYYGYEPVETLLSNASADVGTWVLDFPRMDNPYSDSAGSFSIIPWELYRIKISSPEGKVLNQPQNINLQVELNAPVEELPDVTYAWSLLPPPGSNAGLSAKTGGTTSFMADNRGYYKVNVEAAVQGIANQFKHTDMVVLADDHTETFELGAISTTGPVNWSMPDTLGWEITDDVSYTGNYSICPAFTYNSSSSLIEIKAEVNEDDSISFVCKVSSEEYYDFLRFYIDDVQIGEWTGETDWSIITYPVPKGTHTFKWAYEKDYDYYFGADKAWIDDIFLPESMQLVGIHNSKEIDDLSKIYPNPANDLITIETKISGPYSIELNSVNGQLIYRARILEPVHHINVSSFQKGMYMITIRSEDYTRIEKIIKL